MPLSCKRRLPLLFAALLLSGAAVGCSASIGTDDGGYEAGPIEEKIVELQTGKVGDLELGDATCPDDVELEEGVEFECTLSLSGVEAPFAVVLTEIDEDRPKIHVEPAQAIIPTATAEGFVRSNLQAGAEGAEVSCGDGPVQLGDPGDTIECTVSLDGQSQPVRIEIKDTQGNVVIAE